MNFKTKKLGSPWTALRLAALLVGMAAPFIVLTWAADHRDGPFFGPPGTTGANGRADLNDLYVFQAPGNSSNTVMISTVSPIAGVLTPTTFDQTLFFDFKLDNNGDAVEDMTFRVTFGAPDVNGVQSVTLRGLPAVKFPNSGILAKGKTGQNIPVVGGGMFRADVFDDPFFFDAQAFAAVVSGKTPPPPPGGLRNPGFNAFGPDVNTLGIVLEIPTATLLSSPSNTKIGVWARTERNGVQLDRTARPAINTALIPPVPRTDLSRGDRRNAFNAGLPQNDVRDFHADMVATLKNFYGRTDADAQGLANFLLPDIMTFDTSTAFTTDSTDGNGFPNGRRMRDAVIDFELKLLLNNPAVSQNIPDDNGDRITDGTRRSDGSLRPIAFPYIGPPNNPPTNPANFK